MLPMVAKEAIRIQTDLATAQKNLETPLIQSSIVYRRLLM
jgi:hypothetical protein